MTVAALIEQYNTERPNNIEDALKVTWLRKCEQMIFNEITDSHTHDPLGHTALSLSVQGSTLYIQEAGQYEDHIAGFDLDTELVVPEPYDGVYMFYLDQRIALNQNDTRRYNAAATQYNNALLQYQQYYNRMYDTNKHRKKMFRHQWL